MQRIAFFSERPCRVMVCGFGFGLLLAGLLGCQERTRGSKTSGEGGSSHAQSTNAESREFALPEEGHGTARSEEEAVLTASVARDSALQAARYGDTRRALELWSQAAAIYEGIAGHETDRASCLLNRSLVLAGLGRHPEALSELEEADALSRGAASGGSTRRMLQTVLHREQRIVEMMGRFHEDVARTPLNSAPSQGALRPQVLVLARAMLGDYSFRKSFLMDKAEPVSFPDQVRAALELTDGELSGVCIYASKVHQRYHDLLKKKYQGIYGGAFMELSAGFLAASQSSMEEGIRVADALERSLGSMPSLEDEK